MQWDDLYEQYEKDMTLNINNYGCNQVQFALDTTTDKRKFQ